MNLLYIFEIYKKPIPKLNLFENIFKNIGNQFTTLDLLYFVFWRCRAVGSQFVLDVVLVANCKLILEEDLVSREYGAGFVDNVFTT